MSKVQSLMLRQMPRFQTAFFAAMLLLLAAPGPAKAESLSPGGQIGPGALGSESGNPLAPGGAAGRAAGRAAANSKAESLSPGGQIGSGALGSGSGNPLAPGGAAGRAAGRAAVNAVKKSYIFDSVTKLLIISVATVTSSTSTSSTISSSGTAP